MAHTLRLLPIVGLMAAAGLQQAAAQDRAPERCITLNRLDRTEVVDDRTIIFHMRGGDIYLNHLARECPGLKREERFMYSPTGSRLCDIDNVTVVEQFGFGLTRGFTCSLGMFHPITEVELQDLLRTGESGGDGEFDIVPVDPDDIDAEEGDASSSEGAPTSDESSADEAPASDEAPSDAGQD